MGTTDRDSATLARRCPSPRVSSRHRNGLRRGFRYACEGLRYATSTQPNFRIHLAAAVGVVLLGLWMELPLVSWAILSLTIGGVLVTEVLNTAIEAVVDLVSPDDHILAKHAKDLAAAAVLLAAITSVIVGFIVLGPPLLARVR